MWLPKPSGADLESLSRQFVADVRAQASIKRIAERNGATLKKMGDAWWCCCILHAEKTPSMKISMRDGVESFYCFGCGKHGDVFDLEQHLNPGEFPEIVLRVAQDAGVSQTPTANALRESRREWVEQERAKAEKDRAARATAASALLARCADRKLIGNRGERYARAGRKISASLGDAELYFCDAVSVLPYSPNHRTKCPAVVGRIRQSSGVIVGAHITYLRADGGAKADIKPARKVIGSIGGGFIVVGPGRIADAVVVGEGWESTLSAAEVCGLPGVAAVSAGNMARLDLPARVKRVVIAPDNGEAGEIAGATLAERLWLQGLTVEMMPPPPAFSDWNDAAQAGALPKLGVCA